MKIHWNACPGWSLAINDDWLQKWLGAKQSTTCNFEPRWPRTPMHVCTSSSPSEYIYIMYVMLFSYITTILLHHNWYVLLNYFCFPYSHQNQLTLQTKLCIYCCIQLQPKDMHIRSKFLTVTEHIKCFHQGFATIIHSLNCCELTPIF